jgi:two-component system LytT family response regulator
MSGVRRVVVVDDERLARVELCSLLAGEPGFSVVGEAANVTDALALIAKERPDLVLLDIQLGHETGFDILERTDATFDLIFVTAYDRHAVRAFEVNAVDYLLKPVNATRLKEALRRLDDPPSGSPATEQAWEADDRVFIRIRDRWHFLKISSITAIEAAGDFTTVRVKDGTDILFSKSLREWEARLPGKIFARIHRSTIVNLEFVERVDEWTGQTFQVQVKGVAKPYAMSRRYAARLKQ